jgi:hypothetical protein
VIEPKPNVIEVAKDALYREASLWDAQAGRISDCAFEANHLTIEVYDVPLFNGFFAEYNEVTRVFARLCSQGAVITGNIAQTLRTVADTYEEADRTSQGRYDQLRHDQPWIR